MCIYLGFGCTVRNNTDKFKDGLANLSYNDGLYFHLQKQRKVMFTGTVYALQI